jgi:hypothetical protein
MSTASRHLRLRALQHGGGTIARNIREHSLTETTWGRLAALLKHWITTTRPRSSSALLSTV